MAGFVNSLISYRKKVWIFDNSACFDDVNEDFESVWYEDSWSNLKPIHQDRTVASYSGLSLTCNGLSCNNSSEVF